MNIGCYIFMMVTGKTLKSLDWATNEIYLMESGNMGDKNKAKIDSLYIERIESGEFIVE